MGFQYILCIPIYKKRKDDVLLYFHLDVVSFRNLVENLNSLVKILKSYAEGVFKSATLIFHLNNFIIIENQFIDPYLY